MKKPKRKLTVAEKRAKRERKKKYMFIFINGKQKRVLRPQPEPMIEGIPVDEFIRRNADPISYIPHNYIDDFSEFCQQTLPIF